jgi:hypothetical protein
MVASQRGAALRGAPYVPSADTLSKNFGVSERTIRRWLAALRDGQKILRPYFGGQGMRPTSIVRPVSPARTPAGLFGFLEHPKAAAARERAAERALARRICSDLREAYPDIPDRVTADHSAREGSREQSPDASPASTVSPDPESGAPVGRENGSTALAAPGAEQKRGGRTSIYIEPAWVPIVVLRLVYGTFRAAKRAPYGSGSLQDRTVALAIGREIHAEFGRGGAPPEFAFGPRELARAREFLAHKFERYLRDDAIEDHTLSKSRRHWSSYGRPDRARAA